VPKLVRWLGGSVAMLRDGSFEWIHWIDAVAGSWACDEEEKAELRVRAASDKTR